MSRFMTRFNQAIWMNPKLTPKCRNARNDCIWNDEMWAFIGHETLIFEAHIPLCASELRIWSKDRRYAVILVLYVNKKFESNFDARGALVFYGPAARASPVRRTVLVVTFSSAHASGSIALALLRIFLDITRTLRANKWIVNQLIYGLAAIAGAKNSIKKKKGQDSFERRRPQ